MIPGSGQSPAEGNGNPLQYSCLEDPIDREAWQVTVHEVARVRHDLVTKPPTRKGMEISKGSQVAGVGWGGGVGGGGGVWNSQGLHAA